VFHLAGSRLSAEEIELDAGSVGPLPRRSRGGCRRLLAAGAAVVIFGLGEARCGVSRRWLHVLAGWSPRRSHPHGESLQRIGDHAEEVSHRPLDHSRGFVAMGLIHKEGYAKAVAARHGS
jgi:hypothetical protein